MQLLVNVSFTFAAINIAVTPINCNLVLGDLITRPSHWRYLRDYISVIDITLTVIQNCSCMYFIKRPINEVDGHVEGLLKKPKLSVYLMLLRML